MKAKQGWRAGGDCGFLYFPVTHIMVKRIKQIILVKTGSYRRDIFTSDHFTDL